MLRPHDDRHRQEGERDRVDDFDPCLLLLRSGLLLVRRAPNGGHRIEAFEAPWQHDPQREEWKQCEVVHRVRKQQALEKHNKKYTRNKTRNRGDSKQEIKRKAHEKQHEKHTRNKTRKTRETKQETHDNQKQKQRRNKARGTRETKKTKSTKKKEAREK